MRLLDHYSEFRHPQIENRYIRLIAFRLSAFGYGNRSHRSYGRVIREMQLREIGLDEQFVQNFRQKLINDLRACESERLLALPKRLH